MTRTSKKVHWFYEIGGTIAPPYKSKTIKTILNFQEEVDSYRIVINGKTCVFKKENDPTILRSPSPGKLINFTIEDGGHVFAGESYAEIEVMKMVSWWNFNQLKKKLKKWNYETI